MFGEANHKGEEVPVRRTTPEYYVPVRSSERSKELGSGVGSPESRAGISFEEVQEVAELPPGQKNPAQHLESLKEKRKQDLELLGYPADYDPNDPGGSQDGESSMVQPYVVGREYGYDVYFYPQNGWYVLSAPLPTLFYLDQQKQEVARRYPNYELRYHLGSQILIRKEPFEG